MLCHSWVIVGQPLELHCALLRWHCVVVLQSCFGIAMTYHRMLTHRAFRVPVWLEYTLAYIGTLSLQVQWLQAVHRNTKLLLLSWLGCCSHY